MSVFGRSGRLWSFGIRQKAFRTVDQRGFFSFPDFTGKNHAVYANIGDIPISATKNYEAYSGSATIACTQTSLASGSTRESAVRSNTTALNLDDQIAVTFTIASGSPSTAGPSVNIYANGSVDGTLWPILQLTSGATVGTGAGDASVGALGTPPNLKLIGSFGLQTTTSSAERTFRTQPFSVAAAFGGALPSAYSIMLENSTGVAFSTSTATTAQLVELNGIYTTSGNP